MDEICCPMCRSHLSERLACLCCGEQYKLREGVYCLTSPQLSEGQNEWPESTFEETSATRNDVRTTNEVVQKAQEQWLDAARELSMTFTGVVCDIATGLGGGLEEILLKSPAQFSVVATDVDPNVLIWSSDRWKSPFRFIS